MREDLRLTSLPQCLEHAGAMHGDAKTIASCTRCHRALCAACRRFHRLGEWYCEPCATELREAHKPRWARGVVIFASSTALVALMASSVPWWVTLSIELAMAGFSLHQARPKLSAPWALSEAPSRQRTPGYRPVSARMMAGVLSVSLVTAAFLLPALTHQPRWVEVELVLLGWWAALTATLATLLYRGHWVRHDLFRGNSLVEQGDKPSRSRWQPGLDWLDFEAVGFVLVIGLTLAAAWLVVELVVPFIAFTLYGLFTSAITHVTNSDQRSKDQLLRAIARGALWAFVYVLPLSAVVWVIHRVI